MKHYFIAFLMLLCINKTIAQSEFDELGTWYILSSNSKLAEKWSVQAQTQFRYFELASEIQQFKIRVQGTYKISEAVSLSGGYAYFRNDFSYLNDTPPSFDEHRIVEDILLRHKISSLKIRHRYRLENRFIVQNGDTDFRNWFRYDVQLVYPLAKDWSLDAYNEIWLNVGDEPTFAQNWLGTGVSYKINELIKTRLGYQRIMLDGPDFDRLIVQLHFNFDFRKSKE